MRHTEDEHDHGANSEFMGKHKKQDVVDEETQLDWKECASQQEGQSVGVLFRGYTNKEDIAAIEEWHWEGEHWQQWAEHHHYVWNHDPDDGKCQDVKADLHEVQYIQPAIR